MADASYDAGALEESSRNIRPGAMAPWHGVPNVA